MDVCRCLLYECSDEVRTTSDLAQLFTFHDRDTMAIELVLILLIIDIGGHMGHIDMEVVVVVVVVRRLSRR